MEMERVDRFLVSVLSPGRCHQVSTRLLLPWLYHMLHYIFMTYDFGEINCMCEMTGGELRTGVRVEEVSL